METLIPQQSNRDGNTTMMSLDQIQTTTLTKGMSAPGVRGEIPSYRNIAAGELSRRGAMNNTLGGNGKGPPFWALNGRSTCEGNACQE